MAELLPLVLRLVLLVLQLVYMSTHLPQLLTPLTCSHRLYTLDLVHLVP